MTEEMLLPQKKKTADAKNGGGPTTLPVPQTPAREAPSPQPPNRLHSIFALARDRNFTGTFNARGADYSFTYAPRTAAVVNRRLEITGTLSVRNARGGGAARTIENVKATLLATQGGVAGSPARRQLETGTSGTANVASPNQKQEQAKAPETQPSPGTVEAAPQTPRLPIVDASGQLAFVAALFFQLQPLDQKALGVPVELNKVQLNVRLAPQNQLERDLLWTYSDLVMAVYGDAPDEAGANTFLQQLNNAYQGKA